MRFSRQEYWSGSPFPSPEDLPNPGIEPRFPALQADFFTIWGTKEDLVWKWKLLSPVRLFVTPWTIQSNTRVGSLSLLQGIFPTQGSHPGLPHCRQILYQLSQKGACLTLTGIHLRKERYECSFGVSWTLIRIPSKNTDQWVTSALEWT